MAAHCSWRAEGSGVVPLMAMVRRRDAFAPMVPIALLCSARSWDDVLYRDELIALDERRNGLSLALTLTRERPRRPGDFDRSRRREHDDEARCRLAGASEIRIHLRVQFTSSMRLRTVRLPPECRLESSVRNAMEAHSC